jgi:hypothetical protein
MVSATGFPESDNAQCVVLEHPIIVNTTDKGRGPMKKEITAVMRMAAGNREGRCGDGDGVNKPMGCDTRWKVRQVMRHEQGMGLTTEKRNIADAEDMGRVIMRRRDGMNVTYHRYMDIELGPVSLGRHSPFQRLSGGTPPEPPPYAPARCALPAARPARPFAK